MSRLDWDDPEIQVRHSDLCNDILRARKIAWDDLSLEVQTAIDHQATAQMEAGRLSAYHEACIADHEDAMDALESYS